MYFLPDKINDKCKLLTILLTKSTAIRYLIFISILFFIFQANAQTNVADSVLPKNNINIKVVNDSIKNDSIVNLRDSISPNAIKSKIDYQATDSVRLDIVEKKAYLYNTVNIKYETIELKSGYVEMSFDNNTLFADGIYDSLDKETQRPDFKDGFDAFKANSLEYNFETKKGLVKNIITNQGESYLHGNLVKRFPDNSANIRNGFYTTCDEEHPHYAIKFGKARMTTNDKIVSGPAYMEIEDVPTPLLLPFGYFPNKKGQVSGILLPTWGETANRGFHFDKLGYYWGINDFIDMAIQGDIYTRGSWAVYLSSNYKKRYHYDGNIALSYATNIFSQAFLPDYQKSKDFKIQWTHKQDQKAKPNSSFSANVNILSSNFSKYNPTSNSEYLTNTFESSIAYQTTLFRGKANLSLNLGGTQNVQTKELQLNLPQVNFTVNTFYPFRKKNKAGKLKWYDNISMNYTMNLDNKIQTYDSLLLTPRIFSLMQNGMEHTIPIRSTVKILKFLNWTNSINLTERWYTQSINKQWYHDVANDTSYVRSDTIPGFQMAHEFNYSSSLTTKLYGMYQFKRGAVKAIRHVMTPTISFVYHPNFGSQFWGYYKYEQYDLIGHYRRYSIFENGLYGAPPDGLSGKINFSLDNNLEMKVRSKKDTLTGTKKIKLIDNLGIQTAYDIAKDSLQWDPISINARTRLFNLLDISFAGAWDLYAHDSIGRINKFEWDVDKKILQRNNTRWILGLSYNISDRDFKKKDPKTNTKKDVFFNKWNLSFNFSFSYAANFKYQTFKYYHDTTMTLGVSGEFYITPKWRVQANTGYDFISKKFAFTSFNIHRDLHCWEMELEWIPYGQRKSYNFTIKIKSSILKDLKITQKTDWRDNY